jgi:hypothetical protein
LLLGIPSMSRSSVAWGWRSCDVRFDCWLRGGELEACRGVAICMGGLGILSLGRHDCDVGYVDVEVASGKRTTGEELASSLGKRMSSLSNSSAVVNWEKRSWALASERLW